MPLYAFRRLSCASLWRHNTAIETQATGQLKPWREVVSPHKDVASGRYQQAEFAADLWQVHIGEGSDEYKDPAEFFRRTYLTESLKQLLVGAVRRLATERGGDPVVQLQTNFGGGKTHSMLALYHLFSGATPGDLAGLDAVLNEAEVTKVPKARRVVLVGNKISPGNPSTKPDGTVVRTLWGEIAWQLGGKARFAKIKADDERSTNPGDALRSLFNEYSPCLILIDEWVAYARQLHDKNDLPAGSFADSSRLPGLGEQAWRQLWASAETYSTGHAYPTLPFPPVTEAAICVLCQQDLGDEAKTRLTKFADFVRGQAQQDAQSKRRAAKTLEQQLEGHDLRTGFRDAREDLAGIDAPLAHAVESFFSAAAECRDELLNHASSETPVDQVPLTEGLENLAASLRRRADELEKAASAEQRRLSETREADLRTRRILADHIEAVTGAIRRKASINAFVTCIADTDTRGLTRLSTELTKKYVTSILVGAFADEAKKLGFVTPEIELRAVGGQKGSLYHQVQLKHASRAALPKVVSEGEGRCIALAAFLAELRSAGRPSAIVFDDPVSSLDHRWRDKVAERLVEEARTRQVIVFTHELVFLFALQKAAETTAIPFHGQTLWRHANSAGHVEPDLPWNALSTQKRIGHLKQRWQQAEQIHRVDGPMQYGPIATDLYAKLRQAWERAIEEVLLCGVVERFRRGVETQRLKNIRDIEASDVEAVTDGMLKCSRWEGGHDHALAANDPIPAPADLKKDIDALEEWVASINKRRSKK